MDQHNSNNPTDDLGEFDVGGGNDNQPSQIPPSQSSAPAPSDEGEFVKIPKSEWEQVKQTTQDVERKEYFNASVSAIKKEIPDFDENVVIGKLKEINAKDPVLAIQYNTPVGFKLLWREIQESAAKNDPVNGGMGKGGSDDFSTVLKGATEGKDGFRRKALDMAL